MIKRNQFGGHASGSAHDHIADFIERCDTVIVKDLSMEAMRIQLFPFRLKDKAKFWLKSEPELANAFLGKFYPLQKTSQTRAQL